jgi:hypothetical protein
MLIRVIDHPLFRMALGLLVGLPLSVVALFAAPHGLVLGYGGIVEGSVPFMFAGIFTVLGVAAIIGAWYRLFVRSTEVSLREARVIRLCLSCGVASSLGLATFSAYDAGVTLTLVLGLFALVAALLIKGTPVPNAL